MGWTGRFSRASVGAEPLATAPSGAVESYVSGAVSALTSSPGHIRIGLRGSDIISVLRADNQVNWSQTGRPANLRRLRLGNEYPWRGAPGWVVATHLVTISAALPYDGRQSLPTSGTGHCTLKRVKLAAGRNVGAR